MVQLYQLTDQYKNLQALALKPETTQEELAVQLKATLDNFYTKVEQLAFVVLDMQSDVKAIKEEEERLAVRRKSLDARMEWLKTYIIEEMIALNEKNIKSSTVTVSIQKNPPSCESVDIAKIPEQYLRIVPETKEADKRAIIEHFKATGEVISGVEINTSRQRLVIK